MTSAVEVTLPGGIWLDGACIRTAHLRPLTGEDEAFLMEVGDSLPPAQWTTALLARCLMRLGPLSPVSDDIVRSMIVGDREALLLHLRRVTLGDRMDCILTCPAPECGEKMDLDLSIGNLLLPAYPRAQNLYTIPISEGELEYIVSFRLPSGADQEAAAMNLHGDLASATKLMMSRCISSIVGGDGKDIDELPPDVMREMPGIMASLDPQAEVMLELECPVCGSRFSALFDAASYFKKELAVHTEYIYREVHFLAFYYHWSEAEILGMVSKKRRRYLELIDEALGSRK